MHEDDKQLLLDNVTVFQSDLCLTQVIPRLRQAGMILDEDIVEVRAIYNLNKIICYPQLNCIPNSYKANYLFIQLIQRRGADAMQHFYNALVATGQQHLADIVAKSPHVMSVVPLF
jgi:hypothetical protein